MYSKYVCKKSCNPPSTVRSSLPVCVVCCSVVQCVMVHCSMLQCVAVCCNVLQCGAMRCSVVQCVAMCCSELLCVQIKLCGLAQLVACVSVDTFMSSCTHMYVYYTHIHTNVHTAGVFDLFVMYTCVYHTPTRFWEHIHFSACAYDVFRHHR